MTDEDEIRSVLSVEGVALDDYFLLDDTIMYLAVLEGDATPFALVIEDNALWEASKVFLLARGAMRFSSWGEFEAWQREHGE